MAFPDRQELKKRALLALGVGGPARSDLHRRGEYLRLRNRKFLLLSMLFHSLFALPWLLALLRAGFFEVPAGIPMGKGDKLTKGKPMTIKVQKPVVRKKKRVRQSPISIYEMLKDEELQTHSATLTQFSDQVGVPHGIGTGACAAGSPKGTSLGGSLVFYRIKFDGPDWDSNSSGVAPLMNEVLKAGVVKKVEKFNNNITLAELPKHKDKYFPALLYMTGIGHINASDQEVSNLRDYLVNGGMLFADSSGGNFHEHFVNFMRRVMPNNRLSVIEKDNEVYRGGTMPYALVDGCPIYRKHVGAGPALGMWVGPKLVVFYSRGDLGAGWATSGNFAQRRRDVEQAFRMGLNIITYSLLYYKYTSS